MQDSPVPAGPDEVRANTPIEPELATPQQDSPIEQPAVPSGSAVDAQPAAPEPAEPQHAHDESQPPEPDANYQHEPPEPPGPSLVVRYGVGKSLGLFRCSWEKFPTPGSHVVVRTERGVELGQVACQVGQGDRCGCITPEKLDDFIRLNGPEYVIRRTGKLLRPANDQDIIDARHLETASKEAELFCRRKAREIRLPMKIVAAEHLLGGERIIFYFTSETRVDFRELVRALAQEYHTRIEMRQVGARDEAKLIADYERCGRLCCCAAYMKDLKPVSMRMAKQQKATLDPTKISGRCGRLMCCLRYEDEGYEILRAKLPRRNTWVRTAEHVGRVHDTHILTQLVQLVLADGSPMTVANEEILERDVPAPPMPAPQSESRPPERRRPERPRPVVREAPAEQQQEPESADSIGQGDQPRPTDEPAASEDAEVAAPIDFNSVGTEETGEQSADFAETAGGQTEQDDRQQGDRQPGERRRRRRRRKRHGSGGQVQPGAAPGQSGQQAPQGQGQQRPPMPPVADQSGQPSQPGQPGAPGTGKRRRRRRHRRRDDSGGQGAPPTDGQASPPPPPTQEN